jgi:SAM-dependent methyltransferase
MPTRDHAVDDYRELLALRAARRTGALEALTTTAGTPADVAAETGLTERGAALLIAALADRGFLQAVGGEYEPTNRLLGFLAKRDLRSIGRLPGELDRLEDWLALPATLRGDAAGRADGDGVGRDDRLRNDLGARATVDESTVRAAVTAAVRERPDAERVVTVGDGPGRHADEFARRGFDVTLVDAPEVIAVDRPALADAVDLVAGDPLAELPDADLAFGADVLRRHDADDVRRLLTAAREAVGEGGVAVFVEAVRGETDGAALAALGAVARTGSGGAYDAATLRSWLDAAGFAGAVTEVPGLADRAVVGRAID